MVSRKREPRIFDDLGDDPTPDADPPPDDPPPDDDPPYVPPQSDGGWNPETALEWGKLLDKGLAALRDRGMTDNLIHLISSVKKIAKGEEIDTRTATPTYESQAPPETHTNGASNNHGEEIPMKQAFDMDKLAKELTGALDILVLVKGKHLIEELPQMFKDNEAVVLKQLKELLAKCAVWVPDDGQAAAK